MDARKPGHTLPKVTEDPVHAYLDGVPEPTRTALADLCRVIAVSDARGPGEIKWNAPSFGIVHS